MSYDSWVSVAIVCSLLAFVWSGAWRFLPTWLTFSRPDIELRELENLLADDQEVQTDFNPKKKIPNAFVALRFFDRNVSVIYHRLNLQGSLVEIVDVAIPSKTGVIITLADNHIFSLQRIGGRTYEEPQLDPSDEEGFYGLLERVRKLAQV